MVEGFWSKDDWIGGAIGLFIVVVSFGLDYFIRI
jgi:hypothetical protein